MSVNRSSFKVTWFCLASCDLSTGGIEENGRASRSPYRWLLRKAAHLRLALLYRQPKRYQFLAQLLRAEELNRMKSLPACPYYIRRMIIDEDRAAAINVKPRGSSGYLLG